MSYDIESARTLVDYSPFGSEPTDLAATVVDLPSAREILRDSTPTVVGRARLPPQALMTHRDGIGVIVRRADHARRALLAREQLERFGDPNETQVIRLRGSRVKSNPPSLWSRFWAALANWADV